MERVLIGVLSVLLGGAVPAWSAGLGVVFRDTVVLGDQNTNVFAVTGMSGLMHVVGRRSWP